MSEKVNLILNDYKSTIEEILGTHLVRIVLYGSYARGDFNQQSDIDIMILANVPQEEISSYADKIYDRTYDFEMQYGIEINPSVQSNTTYNQWKKVYPFFINIEKDGVAV